MSENQPRSDRAESPKFAMVVDLNRCIGCQTCTIACKHTNDTTPGIQWRKVLDLEMGTYPDVERLFLVSGCQHCANPPCVPVCPTGATFQREDGLVVMDSDTCLGCGYCAVACPYDARTIAHETAGYFGGESLQEEAVQHPERIGVAQKCTFCIDKIDRGYELGLTPGVDFEATPACASACITQAIRFGDFNDPQSEVSTLANSEASFRLHEELGTEPRIRYLYETPSVPGRDGGESLNVPNTSSAGGQPQTFWDRRAVGNFTLGGMGSGLIVAAGIVSWFGRGDRDLFGVATTVGLILIAAGLLCVWFEIGRRSRALRVLLRPQTSWMSREVYALMVLLLGLLLQVSQPGGFGVLLSVVGAAGFLYCQARILQAAKGIPLWRMPITVPLIVTNGLFAGAALLPVVALMAKTPSLVALAATVALVFGAVDAFVCRLFRQRADVGEAQELSRIYAGASKSAVAALDARLPFVHLLAHGAGMSCLLALVALAGPVAAAGSVAVEQPIRTLAYVAALLVAIAAALLKRTIIVHGSHTQGVLLAKVPQRGSGERAAPRLSRD